MTNDELLTLVIGCIAYANHIAGINTSNDNEIRFTWRGDRFRVSKDLEVSSVEGNILSGGNKSILLRAILQRAAIDE